MYSPRFPEVLPPLASSISRHQSLPQLYPLEPKRFINGESAAYP